MVIELLSHHFVIQLNMNFHEGGPSNFSFLASSSSSDGDEESDTNVNNELQLIDQHQQMLSFQLTSNATPISTYFQTLDNTHHGGSIHGHAVINRDRAAAEQRLYNDYFSDSPMYGEAMFKRRFRMSRRLFLHIMTSIQEQDNYFVQKADALGRHGLTPYQKITAAMRILAYGVGADATDEYTKIGESIAIESVNRFCRATIEVFGDLYLRSPNAEDIERLLHIGKQRGFPANGVALPANYIIQGKEYNMGYYLADDIYPKWATLVQTFHNPQGPKKKYFAARQESCRKDVERAFGLLQSKWAIITGPLLIVLRYSFERV
ncbi:uncharacterized protein [Primulina eburnea]|uniref:uncharacterized protein n=1 Tax=Primulina eburnea TaxID=1245227 RepID=UPI003C6C0720